MNRPRKLLYKILRGGSDATVRFDDLRRLLRRLGFVERTRGSHHIFRKKGVADRIVLQRNGKHAKPYQVRQVRRTIMRHRLELEE